jgi:hypothetical protein
MKPQTAAELAQVIEDLNRSAVSRGRAPRWLPAASQARRPLAL